ncbi:hypothetical protein OKN36_22430 [Furfurilactobacillus sp. OKN36]
MNNWAKFFEAVKDAGLFPFLTGLVPAFFAWRNSHTNSQTKILQMSLDQLNRNYKDVINERDALKKELEALKEEHASNQK